MSPPNVREPGVVSWIAFVALLAGAVGGLVWASAAHPGAVWIFGPLVVAYGILVLGSNRRWRRLQEERNAESIGEFACLLPARTHDTWIVRAVYEELSRDRRISIRPSDRLEQDLGYLPEDFDRCLAEIARRAQRSLNVSEQNPFRGRVVTVTDVMTFLERQPVT